MFAANRFRAVLLVVLAFCVLPCPVSAAHEDVNKYWDSIPAGIDPTDTTDSSMCWAASASNILAYTGWGIDNAGTAYARQYDVYHEFLSRFPNAPGTGIAAYQSYFQWHPVIGTSPVTVQIYPDTAQPNVFVNQAKDLINQGYGLYLSLSIGHAVTLWSFGTTAAGIPYVTITDSDDHSAGTRNYELVQITEGVSAGKWAIHNYQRFDGMTIEYAVLRRIDALAPSTVTVDNDTTFIAMDGSPIGGSNPSNWFRINNPMFLPGGPIPIDAPMTLFRYAVPADWTADEPDGPYAAVPEPSGAILLIVVPAALALKRLPRFRRKGGESSRR